MLLVVKGNDRNVVMVEGNNRNVVVWWKERECGGGGGGKRNVVQLVYSFTIHEIVLKS